MTREIRLNFSADGSPTATASYQLPLPTDDVVQGVAVDPVTLKQQIARGNVEEQARQFGQMVNYLSYGHAKGVEITTEIRNIPSEPMGTFCIDAAGVSAVFRANGTTWAWGGDGMIVGTDALLHGTAGTYGTPTFSDCWVPSPVNVSGLPAANPITTNEDPAQANTIEAPEDFDPAEPGDVWDGLPEGGVDVPEKERDVSMVVEPRNEFVAIRARSRSRVSIRVYDYALDLGTDEIRIESKAKVRVTELVQVTLPTTTLSLGTPEPLVYATAVVILPVTTLTLAPSAPTVEQIGGVVSLPVTTLTLSALAPEVSNPGVVRLPVSTWTLGAVAPTISTLGATDPDFANVSLLLLMDGSNGSTTFTDSSSNALTVTASGNAQISTAQSKFGGASGLFDGSGDYLSVASSGVLDLTGDFTIEFFLYPAITLGAVGFIARPNGSGISPIRFDVASGNLRLSVSSDGTSFTQIAAGGLPSATTWTHVAASRLSDTWRLFASGTQTGIATNSITPFTSTNPMIIGARTSASNFYNGYIDALRITKGVARYTANFTPPTAPFPTSGPGL